jgi:hypothetical protein
MIDQIFNAAGTLLVGFLLVMAIGCFFFLARTRFWFPRYAHILAGIGLAIGVWCIWTVPETAPINEHGLIGKVLLVLAMPAMVYFFFVFYGGQRAAFQRELRTTGRCPKCQESVISNLQGSGEPVFPPQKCPRCGLNLI